MKQNTTNQFKDGLNFDLHPIVTPNSVLTDNLNGTLITYNGNEFCLQNDKGNTIKSTLTEGFIPIGVKEHAGVLYIFSHNPETGEGELGTFPGVDWSVEKEVEGQHFLEKYTPLKTLIKRPVYNSKSYNSLYCFIANGTTKFTEHSLEAWSDNFNGILEKFDELGMPVDKAKELFLVDSSIRKTINASDYPGIVDFIQRSISENIYADKYGRVPFANGIKSGNNFLFDVQWIGFAGDSSDIYEFREFYSSIQSKISSNIIAINKYGFIFKQVYDLCSIKGLRFDENWNRAELENILNDFCSGSNLYYTVFNELKDYPLPEINWDLTTFEELRTTKFNFDLEHPLEIEIQDSYDGSVNLIITDNKNAPRIINTEFSVVGETYKLIKRNQKDYLTENQFDSLTNLVKSPLSFSSFKLNDVYTGGQLKGGNYTFYAKLGDADGNTTDIVAESGVVSIFNGSCESPSTISGTLADERTDKLISLTLDNIVTGYSRVYLYYVREYSNTQGYLMEEACAIEKPYDVTSDINGIHCDISLTGLENTTSISVEDLNIYFYTNDRSKSIAQQQGMLFLANVGNITYDYSKFDAYAKKIKTSLSESKSELDPNFDTIVPTNGKYNNSNSEYYNVQNIYSKVGYWPNEYYRFGVVFILADGSCTSVFNMNGGEVSFGGGQSEFIGNYANDKGVFHTPLETEEHCIIRTGNIVPWHFRFDFVDMIDAISRDSYADVIKGYFIVRQKRIPEVITQGLHIGVDKDAHVPIVPWIKATEYEEDGHEKYDTAVKGFAIESFVGDNNTEDPENSKLLWYGPVTADGTKIKPTRNYLRAVNFTLYRWARFDTKTAIIDAAITVATVGLYGFYVGAKYASGDIPVEKDSKDLVAYLWYDTEGNLINIQSIQESNSANVPLVSRDSNVALWFNSDKYNDGNLPEGANPWIYNTPSKNHIIVDSFWASVIAVNKAIITNIPGTIAGYIYEHYSKDESDLDQNQLKLSNHLIPTDTDPYCSGLLSLEATLCPSIKNRLNGSKVKYETLNKATCKNEEEGQDYDIYGRHQIVSNYSYKVPSSKDIKAVYVNTGNTGKYVSAEGSASEGDMFATEIGSAYNSSALVTILTGNDEKRNVVRGKFPAFIGLTTPFEKDQNDPLAMEICQLANRLDSKNAIAVRAQDNSPYFCVSERMPIMELYAHVYRGDCFVVTETVRMITNFIDPNYPVTNTIVDPHAWNDWYLKGKKQEGEDVPDGSNYTEWDEINSTDLNTVSLGQWVTFKCLASSNIGLRSEDTFDTESINLLGNPKSFYPLSGNTSTAGKQPDSELFNSGYGITTGQIRRDGYLETPYVKQEYANRIMFSNKYVTDEFTNGYRVFQGLSYQDYDKQYGEIVKILPWGNNLFCAFEHGLALLPVNEKALLQTTTEQTIHIYGHGVLPEQMSIISQDYGTKYADSIVRTPIGIYGVDVDARKVWRFSDKQGFETLSDMKIETFLNNTLAPNYEIDLTKCDIRTHYNSFKGDVIFTWYDERGAYSICFNERQSLWVTRYDWYPLVSENINGEFYSLQTGNDSDNKVGIYKHDVQTSKPTQWYGKQHPFEFEFVVSDPIGAHKIYENLQIISNNVQPEELQFEFIGDVYMFNKARIYHTVFNQVLTDKRKFGNEFTRRLKLYATDPSKRVDSENIFNKTNVDTQENENGYTPFRNVSILNDRNNIPLRGHVKKTENATEQYHLVIPQECRNIETWGRRLGNMHYKNDSWFTTIEPIIYDARLNDPNITTFEGDVSKWNSARIRDKWCKIRVRYSGEDLAVITAIKTIVNI